MALGVSAIGGQFITGTSRPRARQSETKSFDPKVFFKANCEECHGQAAEKRFNPYNPEGQMIDAILNGAKAEDTKDMPAFNPKGIDDNKAKSLIDYMKSIRE
jgi:mono/diheme cytochrome c family protein